jgi:serine/threonine-protein kinase
MAGSAYRTVQSGQSLTSSSGNVFLLLEELGFGGQGIVYRAFSEKDDRIVAIKLSANRAANDLLYLEARNMARLNHPHIAEVLEYGTLTNGRAYLVMEYIKAESLESLIDRLGKLPQEKAANISLQIADALEHAHTRGVVHRDLKPRNILVSEIEGCDVVTVIDFGISFLPGSTVYGLEECTYGSLFYMSPEQITEIAISHRSDIYQLGLIYFECLLGVLPFKPSYTAAIAYRLGGKVLNARAEAQLPKAVQAILRRALNRNPKRRQETMAQFACELKALMLSDLPPHFVVSLQAA